MTVSSILSRETFLINVAREYIYTFEHVGKESVVVYEADDEDMLTIISASQYNITEGGSGPIHQGGTVTFLFPHAVGTVKVVIARSTPRTQLVDYQAYGPFPAETHEFALDKLTMIAQEAIDTAAIAVSGGGEGGGGGTVPIPNLIIGRLGINEAAPSGTLTIRDTSFPTIDMISGDGSSAFIRVWNSAQNDWEPLLVAADSILFGTDLLGARPTGDLYIDNAGNVSLGTTTPLGQLTVSGNSPTFDFVAEDDISASIRVWNNARDDFEDLGLAAKTFRFTRDVFNTDFAITENGKTVIGGGILDGNGEALTIRDNVTFIDLIDTSSTSTGIRSWNNTSSSVVPFSLLASQYVFTRDVFNPDFAIDTSGNARFYGELRADDLVTITGSTTALTAAGVAGAVGLFGDVVLSSAGAANGRLELDGSPVSGNGVGNRTYNDGRYARADQPTTVTDVWDFVYLTEFAFSIRVPVFTTSDATWDASGNLQGTISDIRLKDNIVDCDYGLEELKAISPIWYTWRDQEKRGSQREAGFSAQEVTKVIPEAAPYDAEKDTYGLLMRPLVAALVNAVKTLDSRLAAGGL